MGKKKGLTPLDCKKQLHTMVTLVFSGFGIPVVRGGKSEFPTKGFYRAIYQLSKEFPELFPGYPVEMIHGFPYCGWLEDTLFVAGAFNVIQHGSQGHEETIIVNEQMKRIMANSVALDCKPRRMKTYLKVVERFNELIGQKERAAV